MQQSIRNIIFFASILASASPVQKRQELTSLAQCDAFLDDCNSRVDGLNVFAGDCTFIFDNCVAEADTLKVKRQDTESALAPCERNFDRCEAAVDDVDLFIEDCFAINDQCISDAFSGLPIDENVVF